MSDEKQYKLVDGQLVELTDEEIAQREKDAAQEPLPEPKEPEHAKRKSK